MSGLKYIKSFDGLRGIGALFILLYHWPGKVIRIAHGWEFMQLFFVMSGYLITLVLLEEKSRFSFKKYALRFYIKRSLRLFPLYFIYIIIFTLVYFAIPSNVGQLKYISSEVNIYAGYLCTYTYNFMSIVNFLMDKSYVSGFLTTHLWTLSLEEQFYLIFPFVVYFINLKNLRILLISCIILAPIFRVLFYFWAKEANPNDIMWIAQNLVRLPWLQMDSLAFGALLAVFPFDKLKNPVRLYKYFTVFIVLIYAANILYTRYIQGLDYYTITFGKKMAECWMTHNYLFVYIISLVNVWCMLTLLCVTKVFRQSKILENKWLVFIGRRSYAIYLFHLPILFIYLIIINAVIPKSGGLISYLIEVPLFLVFLLFMFGFAEFCYKYIETFFMKYKNIYST